MVNGKCEMSVPSAVFSLSSLPTREGWGRVLPSLGRGWGVGLLIFLLCLPLMAGGAKLRPLVWVLDAGHGGKDVGTESKKFQEKDITLEITKQVAALVRKNKPGIKLILTREKDTYVSLDRRCQIANQANADLFLSIHVNAVEKKPLLNGTESFYANTRFIRDAVLQSSHARTIDRSELLAWLLQKNYREAGRKAGRGAKPERLYVLSHTLMPAVLTEVGFLSNLQDEAYMTSKRGQKEIATAIYKALAEYYETTQAKTHKKTLTRLRNSNGKTSGLTTPKVAQAEEPKQKAEGKREESEVRFGNPEREQSRLKVKAEEAKATSATEGQKTDTSLAAGDTTAQLPVEKMAIAEQADSALAVQEQAEEQPVLASEETPAEDVGPIQPSSTIPVFSIQIVAVSSELRSDDDRLQGLFPVTFVKSGNMYKGLYGGTTDYRQAKKTLASIREKFPDAFIVSYLGQEPITTARALELSRQGEK